MSDSIPLDPLATRRKRLLYQSSRRGTKEADILLGGFARAHVDELDAAQLDRFESLLDASDVDLVEWITGRVAPPPGFDHDVMVLLRRFAGRRR